MPNNNLHDGHRPRMREKYLKFGPEVFSDHEIIEILLFFSVPRVNTNDTAHRLLDRFGSLESLFSADISSLKSVDGVGDNSALLISLVGEIIKRSKRKKHSTKKKFTDIDSVGNYFCERFAGSSKEIVCAMYLDSAMRLIEVTTIAEGSVGEVRITPAKIVREAVLKDAASVIIAHNHPGGVSATSASDRNFTFVLESALSAVEMPLLEHIIVSEVGYAPTMMYKPNTARANLTGRIYGEGFFKSFYQ